MKLLFTSKHGALLALSCLLVGVCLSWTTISYRSRTKILSIDAFANNDKCYIIVNYQEEMCKVLRCLYGYASFPDFERLEVPHIVILEADVNSAHQSKAPDEIAWGIFEIHRDNLYFKDEPGDGGNLYLWRSGKAERVHDSDARTILAETPQFIIDQCKQNGWTYLQSELFGSISERKSEICLKLTGGKLRIELQLVRPMGQGDERDRSLVITIFGNDRQLLSTDLPYDKRSRNRSKQEWDEFRPRSRIYPGLEEALRGKKKEIDLVLVKSISWSTCQ